ncbi:hypothetical protein EON81_06675 [bacterium]|nr:MAG: hypothetical protein EON81_06675 [bacterium]
MLAAALALTLADTPEAALKEFVAAFNRGDVAAASQFVDGADPKADRTELAKMLRSGDRVAITLGTIRRDGDRLIVDVTLGSAVKGGTAVPEPIKISGDTINIVKRDAGWLLVPGPKINDPKSILSSMTAVLKDNKAMLVAKTAAKQTVALSNMKQIALATMMLAGDNKDVLALSQKNAETKIAPYTRNLDVFKDPGTGRDDVYVFNALLANADLTRIESPAETVLWSLGSKGALLFPYGDKDKTVIAYADGHVKVLDREQAAKLRWKP